MVFIRLVLFLVLGMVIGFIYDEILIEESEF